MLRVNEDKVLQDYCELVSKKDDNLAKIEADARGYACAHGYDEEKTQKFIAFISNEIEGDGLSEDDAAKLDILSAYVNEVEEIDEPVDDEAIANKFAVANECNNLCSSVGFTTL